MKQRKLRRLTSIPVLTITTLQEYAGEHLRPESSLLKGLIRRKNENSHGHQQKKNKLSNAATENRACKSTICI